MRMKNIYAAGCLLATTMIWVACPTDPSGDDAGIQDQGEADMLAPTILDHSPASDAVDVALSSLVSVTLSEPIDCSSVDDSMFQILGVSATLSCEGAQVSLQPDADFESLTEYRVYFFASGLLRDLAGNTLQQDLSWQFTTGLGDDTTPPLPPSADAPALPASSDQARAIVGGQRQSHTAIDVRQRVDGGAWQDWRELAPSVEATTWVAWVELDIGLNEFELRARDRAERSSETVTLSSVRSAQVDTSLEGGEVKIDFTLRDLWNDIGDEFAVLRDGSSNMNHFSVDLWVEGPFADTETCDYDDDAKLRLNTRYVATLVRGRDANETAPYFGFWEYNNYRSPNYLAALIEAGQWAFSDFPLATDVARRNSEGEQWPVDASCDNPLVYANGFGQCQPRMMQVPVIDGVTEASIRSNSAAPEAPGQWSEARSYTWDLRDRFGRLVAPGRYLISAVLSVDRAQSGPAFVDAVRAADRETCWDRPEHNVLGSHRVEVLLQLDGNTAQEIDLDERGLAETVDACDAANMAVNTINTCTCAGEDANLWPCNTSQPQPNQNLGQPVRYLDPLAQDGQHAARVAYCPQGPCE